MRGIWWQGQSIDYMGDRLRFDCHQPNPCMFELVCNFILTAYHVASSPQTLSCLGIKWTYSTNTIYMSHDWRTFLAIVYTFLCLIDTVHHMKDITTNLVQNMMVIEGELEGVCRQYTLATHPSTFHLPVVNIGHTHQEHSHFLSHLSPDDSLSHLCPPVCLPEPHD